jgi:hypothetical protein
MMNPRDRYWALVANSGQARIVEMRRKPYEFRPIAELVSEAQHLTSKDLVSDASGRVYHTQGPGTHAMQPRSDPQETAEGQFARSLADKLDKAADRCRSQDAGPHADPSEQDGGGPGGGRGGAGPGQPAAKPTGAAFEKTAGLGCLIRSPAGPRGQQSVSP